MLKIKAINDDIFDCKSKFTQNLLAVVILDPIITRIPSQIENRLQRILQLWNYRRMKIDINSSIPFKIKNVIFLIKYLLFNIINI